VARSRRRQVAKRHADIGGGKKARGVRLKAILVEQELSWISGNNMRSEVVRLGQVMAKLPAVQAWRSTLSDYERARWSSPQSIFNRCPSFHSNGRKKVLVARVTRTEGTVSSA
jgi:hypothetical protein